MTAEEIYNIAHNQGAKFFYPEDIHCRLFEVCAFRYVGDPDTIKYCDYYSPQQVKTMTKNEFMEEFRDVTTFLDVLTYDVKFTYYDFG